MTRKLHVRIVAPVPLKEAKAAFVAWRDKHAEFVRMLRDEAFEAIHVRGAAPDGAIVTKMGYSLLLDDDEVAALVRATGGEVEATVVPSLPSVEAEREASAWLERHPRLRENLRPDRWIASQVMVGSEPRTSYSLILDRATAELLLAGDEGEL
jgi:hypothetical protein